MLRHDVGNRAERKRCAGAAGGGVAGSQWADARLLQRSLRRLQDWSTRSPRICPRSIYYRIVRVFVIRQSSRKIVCALCAACYCANASTAERDAALEQLKIYGRKPEDADPIFTKEVRRPPVYDQHGLKPRRLTQNAGYRDLEPPRLQQPVLHHLPQCPPLPRERHAACRLHTADLR